MVKLKSNIVHKKPNSIKELKYIQIPRTVADFYPKVKLSTNYFYAQSVPIPHSISRGYKFRTIVGIEGKNTNQRTTDNSLKKCNTHIS